MESYRWIIADPDTAYIEEIMVAAGISRPSAMALASQGLEIEYVADFIKPKLANISDPYALPDNKRAAQRIWEAIQREERILIHGDYDADGITASVLLAEVLRENGASVDIFLPHRFDDGYGLTPKSVEKSCKNDYSLLITVDCGITGNQAVDAAQAKGVDVIVTDHHEPSEGTVPNALAVVNTRLNSTPSKLNALAGVGVAFKLCHAFIKLGRERNLGGFRTDLNEVLDLVALGTVADIVSLRGENRALVKAGLKQLSKQLRPGIRALCELTGTDNNIRSPDIAFRIAPRLNAAGRMSDASLAAELLKSQSIVEAHSLAESLNAKNIERQNLENEVLKNAQQQISELYDLEQHAGLVVADDDWHQGVLGIVASRLTRDLHRPCIVLGRDNEGLFCGSGRSVKQVNLVETLAETEHLLTRYGGHPMAAGLSLQEQKLPDFRKSFHESVHSVLPLSEMYASLEICGDVSLREIENGYLEDVVALEPFGEGNPEPAFVSRHVYPETFKPAGQKHTRGQVTDRENHTMDFIAFQQDPSLLPSPPWDIVFRAQINTYKGRNSPQLVILDVKQSE